MVVMDEDLQPRESCVICGGDGFDPQSKRDPATLVVLPSNLWTVCTACNGRGLMPK